MALPTSLKLFIDAKAGRAFPSYSSTSPVTNPSFYLGDQCKLELYLVEDTGLASFPRQEVPSPAGLGIRVAVGQIDSSPTAGHFHLTFGGDTTANLNYAITAANLTVELNDLASITSAGGVTVSKVGDNYAVKFNTNGSRAAFTADAGNLIPLSAVGLSVLQEGSASLPEIVLIHLQQTVAALATSFTPTAASTPTVTTLQAWDGTKVAYRVDLDPAPKGGTFSLSFDALTGTDVSTGGIPVGATAAEVQSFLSANALADLVTVQQVGGYSYDISCAVEPDTAGLSADGSGLLSFSGYAGTLDINTSSAISLLDGAESILTTFEVEISSGGDTLTALQIPCTLRSAVIDEAAVNPVTLDPVLTEGVANGIYLQISNNLSELVAATARLNLDVYSTAEVDALVAGGGGGGSFLPLSGGTMSGAITFDAVGLQNISKGTFDNSLGGYNGISLTCAVGYELNWQGGWLTSSTSSGSTYYPININSGAGSALRVWDLVTNKGCEITHTEIIQSDATYDSEVGGWGFGVQLTSDNTQNATVEYNQVRVANGSGSTSITPTGITFPDSTTLSTAPASGVTYKQALALAAMANGNGAQWGGSYYYTAFAYPVSLGGVVSNDWTTGNVKVSIGGYLFSFSYLSSGSQYLNTMDDTSTVSATGSGETLYLNYDGENAPYPFLIT